MIQAGKTGLTHRLFGPLAFWRTLRFRFAFWVGSLLLVAQLVIGIFVYVQLKNRLLDTVDDTLRLNAVQIRALIEAQSGTLSAPDSAAYSSLSADLQEQRLTARILSPQGDILQAYGIYRDIPVSRDLLEAAQGHHESLLAVADPHETDENLRVMAVPILEQGELVGIVEITQTLESVYDTLEQLLILFQLGIPVSVVVAALGGYGLAARALSRVDHISAMARRISAEDLSARLVLPVTNDEVGRLSKTFDMMLDRLEASFQRERQFTSDASHELRTPLAAMRAILDTIRSKQRTVEEYERALDDLAEETNRLQSLVGDLLNLTRNETPATSTHEVIDLSTLLQDISETLRPLAESKGLRFVSSVSDGLNIVGDRDQLIRLVVNLLDNAIKFTDQGEVKVSAEVGTENRIKIAVTDTGRGIPVEHLAFIFDRFYRVDKSRTAAGTGLGLALALSIARAHGGMIEVTSETGKGSVFTVWLSTTSLPYEPEPTSIRE